MSDQNSTMTPAIEAGWNLPDLVPARILNEFCYCPRLAYLEWVQGEFAHSADTLEGSYEHRRVDRGGGKLPESGEAGEEKIHARSVQLSAPELGMIAVIDVLESEAPADGEQPAKVIPVDYKRGTVPDIPGRAWEPERVQLCAQGLILRENGYCCEEGVIYYTASRTRVTVPFDEALCVRTRELLDALRETARQGRIPPPLVDSPKCPRCSLVGICLPDETHYLAEKPQAPDTESVRPLAPSHDDAQPLYVQENGAYVGLKGECLEVKIPEHNGTSRRKKHADFLDKLKGQASLTCNGTSRREKPVVSVRLAELSQVSLFGNVQISTQALRRLCDLNIPVAYFSYGGWFSGITLGLPSKNVELRQQQYASAADPATALGLARRFVWAKIENQRTLLRRNHVNVPPEVLEDMKSLAQRAIEISSASSLLGVEGNAARAYFSNFNGMLKPKEVETETAGLSLDFEKRTRRPPTDPVNALLSYAYAMLTRDMTIACWVVGFDPFLGFFHQPRYGRPALALDLMEEFRALIADSAVLTAVNNGIIDAGDFVRRGPAVALKPEGRRRFLQTYERRLESLVTHPVFGYRISYRRALELQARLLVRTLSGELPEYIPFTTR